MRRTRPAALAALAALVAVPAATGLAADDRGAAERTASRIAALDAAAAWHDALEAHRAPQLPVPNDTESAILLLAGPAAAEVAPARRAATARAISESQDDIERTLADLGATVTFRYRVLVNGLAVRVPAGRMGAVASLPEVRAVVPVSYMAPAQAPSAGSGPDASAAPDPAPTVRGTDAVGRPAHIALIDAGIDAGHPMLGGGIGPDRLILGGADLVDGDDDPTAGGPDPALEAHGTQMASLILGSPALEGLPPEQVPRLLAYRVVAPEAVAGRWRPLARTDRVLGALERAVDPDGDGATGDRADVILLGLAGGMGGGGTDPVAKAVATADRAGSLVVVPAGNDGPTNTASGSVGPVASVPTALTVGALAADGVRRSALEIEIGPARARLEGLPSLGAAGMPASAPVVLLEGPDGPSPGSDALEYRTPSGRSLVEGAIAIVGRGGAPIAQKAAHAARAGAVGLLVWDLAGPATFPGALAGPDLPIPVAGLGPGQGSAVVTLMRRSGGVRARIVEDTAVGGAPQVASFSSRGPTADGLAKPDLIALGVGRATAWPRDGIAATGTLTGTSAAAADVAARALRVRVDRPELGPQQVRSLLIQGARPIAGAGRDEQGAGVVGAAAGTVALDPAVVTSESRARRISVRVTDLAGAEGRFSLLLLGDDGAATRLAELALPASGTAVARVRLPAGARGELQAVPAEGGDPVASAGVIPRRVPGTPSDALGRPLVVTAGGVTDVRVRVGLLERAGGRVRATRLHDVRLALVPVGGGAALPLSQSAHDGGWPQGTYRFLVSRRLATGLAITPGRYRLRVSGTGPDGRVLRTESAPFRIARQ